MLEPIFVFGASGHAKVLIDAARRQGRMVAGLFDDNPALTGAALLGCTVVGGRALLRDWCAAHGVRTGIVAIGQNAPRASVTQWLEGEGFEITSVVHPHALLGEGVQVGHGTVVMAGAIVNADSTLGSGVIVNTGATVDHDCVLGDYAHIAPGCHLCGNVHVGAGALIGAGSIVIPGIEIGEGAIVGAGSTVIRDVPANTKVAGSPCRILN